MNPRITVLLPVYNAEKYINESVHSILNQTFKDFELIIINDGSTDSSLHIINGFTDDRIVKINNNENIGLIDSLNKGLGAAKGEYIARMDADDISIAERFEKQINYLDNHPTIDILGTGFEIFGSENKTIQVSIDSKELEIDLYFQNIICHPSIMMRTKSLVENKLTYEKKFTHNEDWAFWLTAVNKGLKINNLNEVLLKYRLEGQNITTLHASTAFARHNSLYSHFLKDLYGDCNQEIIDIHQFVSNPKSPLYSNKKIQTYFRKIEKALILKQYDKTLVTRVLNSKKKKLFYVISDLNKTQAIHYLFTLRFFKLSFIRYLMPSIK